jgi:anti-sigma regulatory factor (Ser/Thr protein kinase)
MLTQHRSGGNPERLVYERALPAVPHAVGRMRHELDEALERIAVPDARRHEVALVLTEAAANVVVHAYDGPSPGLLYTHAGLSGSSLVLDVCDAGRGMMPNPSSPGLGVGLALIAQLTDRLDIEPNGAGGLRVSAVFHDMPAAAAVPETRNVRDERLRAYADALAQADPNAASPEDAASAALELAKRLRTERLSPRSPRTARRSGSG